MREIFGEFTNPADIIHLSAEDIGRRYITILKQRRDQTLNGGSRRFLVFNELLAADRELQPLIPHSSGRNLSQQQMAQIKQALSEGWS